MAFFVRAYYLSFSYIINKALDVSCIKNCVLLVFLFYLALYQNSYCLTHTHISWYRSTSTLDPIDNDSATASYDFENPINQAEDEGEDDCEVPGNLLDCYYRKRGPCSLQEPLILMPPIEGRLLDLILDNAGQFNGVHAGAAWRVWPKRACYLLP